MLSFLYVYSDHSILECYNLFSGVELSMRSFFVIFINPTVVDFHHPLLDHVCCKLLHDQNFKIISYFDVFFKTEF